MTATEKTCAQLVSGKLKNRLEDLLPDIDSWTADACRQYLKHHRSEDGSNALDGALDYVNENTADDIDWQDAVKDYQRENPDMIDRPQPMAVSASLVVKVEMSGGGPADFFELFASGGEWTGGRYVYQDWFDGADQSINYQTAEALADLWGLEPDASSWNL